MPLSDEPSSLASTDRATYVLSNSVKSDGSMMVWGAFEIGCLLVRHPAVRKASGNDVTLSP